MPVMKCVGNGSGEVCSPFPVKVREGMEIQTLISEIQNELSGTPMGWLGRAIKNKTNPTNLSKQDQLSQLMDEEW